MKNIMKYISPLFILTGSYLILAFVWDLVINSLLVPWDAVLPENRPELGSFVRTTNDYFETTNIPILGILVFIGLFILIIKIKKNRERVVDLINYTGITNMIYIGLAVPLAILMKTISSDIGYNLIIMAIHFSLIIMLFFVQARNYNLYKKIK